MDGAYGEEHSQIVQVFSPIDQISAPTPVEAITEHAIASAYPKNKLTDGSSNENAGNTQPVDQKYRGDEIDARAGHRHLSIKGKQPTAGDVVAAGGVDDVDVQIAAIRITTERLIRYSAPIHISIKQSDRTIIGAAVRPARRNRTKV